MLDEALLFLIIVVGVIVTSYYTLLFAALP